MTSGTPMPGDDALSIGDLAARTGVSAATLRTWESRYGAPTPRRLAGGHRRYQEQDIELVRGIVRRRSAGQAMVAAVADTLAAMDEPEASVFAGLRRHHDTLKPQVVRKQTLLALSRAIEDECCAQAQQPFLFVSFQRRRFFEQSRQRWDDLSRTARSVTIFADFDETATAGGVPLLVGLPANSPLRREWVLVCDATDYPACVAGWEHPGQGAVPDGERRYETIWSADPQVVRSAARICARLADRFTDTGTSLAGRLPEQTPPPPSADLERAEGLFNRTLGYLDARS